MRILLALLLLSSSASAEVGLASWYGGGERLNRHTASGQRFNPHSFTCAHRNLPMGTKLIITNLRNGRQWHCHINDRGPARWTGRVLDVTRAVGEKLGMIAAGVVRVRFHVVRHSKSE